VHSAAAVWQVRSVRVGWQALSGMVARCACAVVLVGKAWRQVRRVCSARQCGRRKGGKRGRRQQAVAGWGHSRGETGGRRAEAAAGSEKVA